jgi:hypothetical protein
MLHFFDKSVKGPQQNFITLLNFLKIKKTTYVENIICLLGNLHVLDECSQISLMSKTMGSGNADS